ncbi:flagellar filament capping protein FliD [Lacisediminihabitans sp.]|jgi:flagellar hook-associated protein 2|uniref:flagellar filament capping protein FliD n=1 Tax=Lacisediminihabitans sp. TaxID=2787631 RepID=UPI002F9289C0
MAISLDGLSSGLDTTSLITQLMTVAAQPQTLLKGQVSTTNSELSAFQGLNSRLATLADAATAAAKPSSLDLYSATSSSTGLAVTVATGASAGELQVVVSALAQSQIGVSAAMAAWPSPSTITIVGHSGTPLEITPASNSLDDVVSAINGSTAGVSAIKVASGFDGSGNQLYRIQFSSTTTGADSAFSVYQGTASDVAAGTATNVLTAPGSAVIRTAQDASIKLFAGTTAEQVITSSTNTFTDLLPGVTVTASAVSAVPVAISVARDDKKISDVASGLVASVNSAFVLIAAQTAVSTSTDANGVTTTRAGVFAGDSTIRDIRQKTLDAVGLPINGHSPSEYGISVDRTGTVTFDSDKFAAALAADPTTTMAAIQTVATRLAASSTAASDKYDGTLTNRITGDQTQLKSLGDQISAWDTRLAIRKSTLERTFSQMEVMLSNLKAQSAALSSQLSSLSTSTTTG